MKIKKIYKKILKVRAKIAMTHLKWNHRKDKLNYLTCRTHDGLKDYVEKNLSEYMHMNYRLFNFNHVEFIDGMGHGYATHHTIKIRHSDEVKEAIATWKYDCICFKSDIIKYNRKLDELQNKLAEKWAKEEKEELNEFIKDLPKIVNETEHLLSTDANKERLMESIEDESPIEKVVKYKVLGAEYDTLEEAEDWLERYEVSQKVEDFVKTRLSFGGDEIVSFIEKNKAELEAFLIELPTLDFPEPKSKYSEEERTFTEHRPEGCKSHILSEEQYEEIYQLVKDGTKLMALKTLKGMTGFGLKECKYFCDNLQAKYKL